MFADLKFATRSLLKTPGFTIVALLTLTLGIGVNTTMFTVLNTLLFQDLPFPRQEELVRVFRTSPQSQRWPHAVANYLDVKAQAHAFSALAGYNDSSCSYAEPGQPAARLRGMDVTAEFFPLLEARAELGRLFLPGEAKPGAAPVVVLSHESWMQRFGGDPGIISRQIRLDGALATVVGVMPAGFSTPLLFGPVDVWRPLIFSAKDEQNRENNFMKVIGRLAPGSTLAAAGAELQGIAARLARDYPVVNSGNGLRLVPLAGSSAGDTGRTLGWLIMALAGFVLLIACANLANLQFARTTGRSREYAIRVALGAPRWRIMRELLVESLLLALAGAAGGLLAALWGNDLLGRQIGLGQNLTVQLAVDPRVFGFALGAAVVSALAFGLLPAWLASRADVNEALKQQARGSTAGHSQHRLRRFLIVTEVALALILLAGAGVFARGLQKFTQRDPGWHTAGLLVGAFNLPASRYPDDTARAAFFKKLEDRLAANPQIKQVALASSLPIRGYNSSTSFIVEGRPEPRTGQEPLTNMVLISPGFFDTLGLTLKSGRVFTAADTVDTPRVAIINETMARALWPGENPVGRRIGDPNPADRQWTEIVGVVNDAASPGQLSPPDTRFQLYQPLAHGSFGFATIAVRGQAAPDLLGPELSRAVAAIDPDLPVFGVGTAQGEIDRAMGDFKLMGGLLGGFAGLGLCLAALGIYGVLAGFVAERRTEIGLRMALGAQRPDVLQLVLGRGLGLTVVGVGLGLLGSFGLIRALGGIMTEFGSPDLPTMAAVVLTLLGVAFVACWLPARRATKVDPMVALRAE